LYEQVLLAGIDEVGRGCLAGPVVAAAVILSPDRPISGLTDSKKLTHKQRLELSEQIKKTALAWSIGRVEASEIDLINILQASLLAMQRAYKSLTIKPQEVLVDGNRFPNIDCPGRAVIKGDLLIPAISAASIVAKVARDSEMALFDQLFPGYEFITHKGYPTLLHRSKLAQLGISFCHRQSFGPVKKNKFASV
jgi:ribonuclease HII